MEEKGQLYQDDLTSKMIKCGHLLTHKTGKKRGQEKILNILFQKQPLSQKELQDILQVEAGSLSEILAKLERNGFINRSKDKNDKRRLVISLTEKGICKMKCKKSNDEDMFDMLSIEEQQELNKMLDRILHAWKERHHKYHQEKI